MSGLTLLTREEALEKEPGTGIFLMTMPNNPNGCTDYREEQIFVDRGEYVLHDAAYWSPVYGVGSGVELPLAHGRVYSYSKAMGLSGIRLGYALVGENLYGACKEAMEASTSGASVLSQQLVLSLLEEMEEDPRKKTMFECQALATITLSRKLFLDRIKGSSVSTKSSIDLAEQGKGMFLWLEKGWGYNPDKARVRTIDGENFGDSTHFRVSLGGKTSDILEAANRLVEACFGTETQET